MRMGHESALHRLRHHRACRQSTARASGCIHSGPGTPGLRRTLPWSLCEFCSLLHGPPKAATAQPKARLVLNPLGLATITARRPTQTIAGAFSSRSWSATLAASCLFYLGRRLQRQVGALLSFFFVARSDPRQRAGLVLKRPVLSRSAVQPAQGVGASMTGSRGEALRRRQRARGDRAGERPDWADRHISGILSLFIRGNLDTFWIRSGNELDAF